MYICIYVYIYLPLAHTDTDTDTDTDTATDTATATATDRQTDRQTDRPTDTHMLYVPARAAAWIVSVGAFVTDLGVAASINDPPPAPPTPLSSPATHLLSCQCLYFCTSKARFFVRT